MSECLYSLFKLYNKLIVLDVETTGLDFSIDSIIEVAALLVRFDISHLHVIRYMDTLVKLPEGRGVPSSISALTGINDEILVARGSAPDAVAVALARLLQDRSALFVGYNVRFDLRFIKELLQREKQNWPSRLAMLDMMEVYRRRKNGPHRLVDAMVAYGLTGNVHGAHRAVADAVACLELLRAMTGEYDDLADYVQVFEGSLA